MKEKLLNLLESEGLRPSQLADQLGVNPAGISHILAGRNKPSFDLLQKILRRFPRLNPDWLLLDSSEMYRIENKIKQSESDVSTLNSSNSQQGSLSQSNSNASSELDLSQPYTQQVTDSDVSSDQTGSMAKLSDNPSRIRRVIILYDDGTFESYSSAAKH